MALPRLGPKRYNNRNTIAGNYQTPGFIQRLVDPTMGGTRRASWSQRFLSATYRGVVGSGLRAAGSEGDFISPYDRSAPSGYQERNSTGNAADSNELLQALAPLSSIATELTEISGGVNQIIKLLQVQPEDRKPRPQPVVTGETTETRPTAPQQIVNNTTNQILPRENRADNRVVAIDGIERQVSESEEEPKRRKGAVENFVEKTASIFKPQPVLKNDDEPGSVGGYQQHERDDKPSDESEIKSFGDGAMRQLGELFDRLAKKMEDGPGLSLPALPSLKLSNPFKRAPKVPKATKFPADKSARAAAQPRAADGRFIPKAPTAPVKSGIGGVGGALRAAANNSKVLGVTRGAGLVAAPIVAGLDFFGRKEDGQTNVQAGVGAAGGLAGAAAGGFLGAESGAIIGGGIGAMFGGVGAVPGAAIGGVIGGVGGAIAGSGVGGWVADKFTGADQPKATIAPKPMGPTPQTKDMIALDKTLKKKEEEKRAPASPLPVVNAPTTSTTIVNQSQQLIPGGGSSRGPRGSLDLKKY